jgi:hypothetical protein
MLPARKPEYNPRARAEKAEDPAVGISLLAWGAPLSGAVSVFQISHRRKVGASTSNPDLIRVNAVIASLRANLGADT